jgi:hypothetical protein
MAKRIPWIHFLNFTAKTKDNVVGPLLASSLPAQVLAPRSCFLYGSLASTFVVALPSCFLAFVSSVPSFLHCLMTMIITPKCAPVAMSGLPLALIASDTPI